MSPKFCFRFVLAVFLLTAANLFPADPATFAFQAIPQRQAAKNWQADFGFMTWDLHQALRAYELNPNAKTAIGVLKYYKQFKGFTLDQRTALLRSDPDLFVSIDIMKYELVMRTRAKLVESGAVWARRVGSSAEREAQIIDWVQKQRVGPPPDLNPEKQFYADDDITLGVSEAAAQRDVMASEKVNGSSADAAYRWVVNDYFKFEGELKPADVETNFLSPTQAWRVAQNKALLDPAVMPDFLFEWVRSNPEKYNDQFGIEMLEVWAYNNKGRLTLNLLDPVTKGNTVLISEHSPTPPQKASPSGEFAYIANNYRQIYEVHPGDFHAQCKYLVRMIDAWEARSGPGSLPPGYETIRNTAKAIYINGIPGSQVSGEFASFRNVVDGHISDVVQKSHEYHLDRVADAIKVAIERRGANVSKETSMNQLLEANSDLDAELNLLAIAYANIPPDVHEKLLDQFRRRIRAGEASADRLNIFKSDVFSHIMAATQERVDYSRLQTDALADIHNRISKRFSEYLKNTDLDAFILEIAKGKVLTKEYRLVDGWIREVDRMQTPEDVMHGIRYIDAAASLFNWSNKKYAEYIKAYFEPDPGLSISLLRGLHEFLDSSKAHPIRVQYKDADGNVVTRVISPSGTSLGSLTFTIICQGADYYGKVLSADQLRANLKDLLTGGNSDEDKARLLAGVLISYLDLHELGELVRGENWFKIRGENVWGQIALGGVGAAFASGPASTEASKELAWAVLKDIATIYMPNLAMAITLAEISYSFWSEYSLKRENNAIITAMVENGVWNPSNLTELKKLKDGELPELRGIRDKEGGATQPVEKLAKIGFEMELIESKTHLVPREVMLDLAHGGGFFINDPAIKADLDAITTLEIRSLPPARNWTQQGMKDLGIVYGNRSEDDKSPADIKSVTVDPEERGAPTRIWVWMADLKNPDAQLRLTGYIIQDFWYRQQKAMEGPILAKLKEEAARQWLIKLKEKQVENGNYEFMSEVQKLDRLIKEIDKALWPLIARSADPYPGPDYNPETDTAILNAFRRSTAGERRELQQYETFLKNPDNTAIPISVPGLADSPQAITLDRRGAAKEAAIILTGLRNFYFLHVDAYEQLHSIFDAAVHRLNDGKVRIEPLHVQLAPENLWTRVKASVLDWTLSPAAGPTYNATQWLAPYKDQRNKTAKDIQERAKTKPISEGLLDWVKTLIDRPDTSGSPAHPLWPELMRLRYQIQKLRYMKQFQEIMTTLEAHDAIGYMTIKKGEAVSLAGLSNPRERGLTFTRLISEMEAEYQRLLDQLTQVFDIAMEMKPTDPFIGQEVQVKASPKADPRNTPPATPARIGFPDYVAKFRWIIRDENGPIETTETNSPEFKAVLKKAYVHQIVVQAVDRGGNTVAEGLISTRPRPLTLTGEAVLEEGDYEDQPISIVAGGAGRGAVGKLGAFGIEIKIWDENAWNQPMANAVVVVDNEAIASASSTVSVDTARGLLQIANPLKLSLPFNVAITVDIKDRAGLDVPGAKVIIMVGGTDRAMVRQVTTKVKKGQEVSARVEFPPLALSQNVPPVQFDPKQPKKEIKLSAVLPIFDRGNFTVIGRFVPSPSISPVPTLEGGHLAANIGNSTVARGGGFRFTNAVPIDMRSRSRFEARAYLNDTNRKIYRPKTEPISVQITDKLLDLGAIEVQRKGILIKPITARLFDNTAKPLPVADGQVFIGGTPAVNRNGLFEGEYTFDDVSQEIDVEGRYILPDGKAASGRNKLSLQMLGGLQRAAPPETMNLVLPFYLPGNLHLTGSTRVADVPRGQNPPTMATLSDTRLGIPYVTNINAEFDFTAAKPIRVGEQFNFQATGSVGSLIYQGAGSGRAPDLAGPANLGVILLRPAAGAAVKPPGPTETPAAVRASTTKPKPLPADDRPAAVRASTTPTRAKIIVAVMEPADDSVDLRFGTRWYRVLRNTSSVTAVARYNDGTEDLISGTDAYDECAKRGYYVTIAGVGIVRSGRAAAASKTPVPQTSETQGSGGGGGAGSTRPPTAKPATASGSQPDGEESTGGRPRRVQATGTGNTILGVDFRSEGSRKETEDEFQERIRKYTELSLEDQRKIDAVREEAENELERCRERVKKELEKCINPKCRRNLPNGWPDDDWYRECSAECHQKIDPKEPKCVANFRDKHIEADELTNTLYEQMLRRR